MKAEETTEQNECLADGHFEADSKTVQPGCTLTYASFTVRTVGRAVGLAVVGLLVGAFAVGAACRATHATSIVAKMRKRVSCSQDT